MRKKRESTYECRIDESVIASERLRSVASLFCARAKSILLNQPLEEAIEDGASNTTNGSGGLRIGEMQKDEI